MYRSITVTISTILLIFFCTTLAYSANEQGFYVDLNGGVSLLNESSSSDSTGSYHTSYDPGPFVAFAVGYDLGEYDAKDRGGRLELEGSYRSNDLKSVEFANSKLAAGGTISVTSIMVNSIGESHVNPDYSPYAGIGIGAAKVVLENANMAGNVITDDESVTLAYQIMLGISVPATTKVSIDVGYRFFKTLGLDFTDSQGRDVETGYDSHNMTLGLRVAF